MVCISLYGWGGAGCEIIDWPRQWGLAIQEIEGGSSVPRYGQPIAVGGGVGDDACVSRCIVVRALLVVRVTDREDYAQDDDECYDGEGSNPPTPTSIETTSVVSACEV